RSPVPLRDPHRRPQAPLLFPPPTPGQRKWRKPAVPSDSEGPPFPSLATSAASFAQKNPAALDAPRFGPSPERGGVAFHPKPGGERHRRRLSPAGSAPAAA